MTTRKPTGPQRALLAELAAAGGVEVTRAHITGVYQVGTWLAVEAAGWVEVDRGPSGHAMPDDQLYTLTAAGYAAIGRPTPAEAAERAERDRVAELARRYGWRPAAGDAVVLADGPAATVCGGGRRESYACRDCGGRHPFPDVRTERQSIMGAAECQMAPTVDTARAYLLDRAARLDAEIAAVPGYPANDRWAAEAATLRAAAAELAPAELAVIVPFEPAEPAPAVDLGGPGESAYTVPGDAERTAEVEADAAELASVRADEAAELAAERAGSDWVDHLMAGVESPAPNPHGHCSTLDTRPCPTGEHTNPAEVEPAGRTGWVWGIASGRPGDGGHYWLTVLGSAYDAPELAATAADALRPGYTAEPMRLARVVEVSHPGVTGPRGMAYRVLEWGPGEVESTSSTSSTSSTGRPTASGPAAMREFMTRHPLASSTRHPLASSTRQPCRRHGTYAGAAECDAAEPTE